MSSTHLYDEHGVLRGCSAAWDLGDDEGRPIGVGGCDHHFDREGWPRIVAVPMPTWRDGWRVHMDFTETP